MKKYLVFLFLIIISCQKDEIMEPPVLLNMVFENTENIIKDGQDISFNLVNIETYELILFKNTSVVSKEIFTSVEGINTRKIYTKILPSGNYQLVLQNGSQILNKTLIVVEWKNLYYFYSWSQPGINLIHKQ